MKYISINQVIAVHDALINQFGGLAGMRDRSLLESALSNPMMCVFGRELHHTVFDKAASYLHSISRNHPFLDANKRTASACALLFLRANRQEPYYDLEEYMDLVLSVAQGNKTNEQISEYFKGICLSESSILNLHTD